MPLLSRIPRGLGSFLSLLVVGAGACTVNANTTPPETVSDPAASAAGVASSATAVSDPSGKLPDFAGEPAGDWLKPNPSGKADGEACAKPDDCKSGVCEGEGCDTGPRCVAQNRMCTRDLVTYCGCDGKTFHASGSCAGRPFAKRGACN